MPQVGEFELYPEARPALTAGSYILAVDHDLTAAPPHNAPGDISVDGTDVTFRILSPRYTMPPDQILSTFPPAGAVGDWRERLPQIVFKRRTLPWERNPDPTANDDAGPPFLALVVLAEGEGVLSGDVPIAECVTADRHLDDDNDTATGRYLEVRESIVQRIFPTVEDLRLLTHVRKVNLADTELALNDDDGFMSVVVGNRLPQPGPPDDDGNPTSLRYTAYLVNVEQQVDRLPTTEVTENDVFVLHMPELVQQELYAAASDRPSDVLVMQGLPAMQLNAGPVNAGPVDAGPAAAAAPDTTTVARARRVGMAPSAAVEKAAAAFATGPSPTVGLSSDATRSVDKWKSGTFLGDLGDVIDVVGVRYLEPRFRFPVLASWDFVCTGDGGFERLMNDLHSGMLGTVDERIDPALQPDLAPTGHLTLDHRTRRGDATQAWYRGPLVPQPTERTMPDGEGHLPLAHTGDQLRRVVPDGREDLSQAAAFEIGRLLALSKPGIVSALMAWRNELFGAARAQQLGDRFVGDLVTGLGDRLALGGRSLQDLVADRIVRTYADAAVERLGPAASDAPVARPPAVVRDLNPAAVLAGFGLEPGRVREATKQFGVEGLGLLDAAVAEATIEPLSATKDIAVLRAALDGRVADMASQALKLGGLRPSDRDAAPAKATKKRGAAATEPTTTTRRRRAKRDALDDVIARASRPPTEER